MKILSPRFRNAKEKITARGMIALKTRDEISAFGKNLRWGQYYP